MATIIRFEELPSVASSRRHTDVECGFRTVETGGVVLLQLDTYGSSERQIRGKTSQSLQFDLERARELVDIIDRVFPKLAGRRDAH
jgi:hypothetical protein